MERKRTIRTAVKCGSSDKTVAQCTKAVSANMCGRIKVHGVRIKCFGKWVEISPQDYYKRKESFKGWRNIEVC